MIAFIEGIIESNTPLKVLINVNGIGYEINAPLSTTSKIGPVGSRAKILTQLIVREDSQSLYGFITQDEKSAFVALTEKVSGIGPKIALSILSQLSVQSLVQAVLDGNVHLLTQCPGIGKKTAERLVLELKDAFKNAGVSSKDSSLGSPATKPHDSPSTEEDAISALITLGFKQVDAQKRVARIMSNDAAEVVSVEQIIKKALSG
jgi:Holliday junction DNA helicase RuvA